MTLTNLTILNCKLFNGLNSNNIFVIHINLKINNYNTINIILSD